MRDYVWVYTKPLTNTPKIVPGDKNEHIFNNYRKQNNYKLKNLIYDVFDPRARFEGTSDNLNEMDVSEWLVEETSYSTDAWALTIQ